MSGLDFTKMARASVSSPNPYVPIIMITGNTSVEIVNDARDAGVNEFLAKPVSVKSILGHLTSVIEHPRPYMRAKAHFGPCRRRRSKEEYRGPERRSEDENALTKLQKAS